MGHGVIKMKMDIPVDVGVATALDRIVKETKVKADEWVEKNLRDR